MVSPLILGCAGFGTRSDEAVSTEIINRSIDAGINFIDTANSYTRGVSETIVGRALKSNGHRNRVVLASKVHFPMADDDPNASGTSRRHIVEQCDLSLRRLQTDWIDLYQIHRPHSDLAIDETLRALDDLVRAGKVRYIGSSTHAAWQVIESLWVAKELGLNRFVSEQPPYHLLDRRIEPELIPMALTYGLAIIPWSPLAFGTLSGIYRRGQPRPESARLSNVQDTDRWRGSFSDAAFTVVETLTELADQKGCTISQLAVAWCSQQPGVTAPIIGPRTLDHLDSYLESLNVSVTDEDQAVLDKVIPPGGVIAPYYEGDFGPAQFRW